MAQITDVVMRLLESSQQGKVNWMISVDEQTFVAVIGNNSVTLYSRGDGVVLRILDKAGREIERIDTATSSEYRPQLEELHRRAKNQALKVAAQLDELLKQLEAT